MLSGIISYFKILFQSYLVDVYAVYVPRPEGDGQEDLQQSDFFMD